MTPEVRTTYRLVSMGVLPAWAAVLLTLLAATAALLLLRGELRRRRRRKAPALLYAARGLLIALLGFLVAQPVLFIRREWDQPGVLAVIADRSRSMLRADRYSDATRLDLASALKWPAVERREILPEQARRRLAELEPVAERWRRQVSAIQDELAQGLPWGAAFGETVSRLAKEATAGSADLRELADALGKLEARLSAATKPSRESPAPDPKLFAPVYLLADRLASLRDALGKAKGAPLDEDRAASLLRAQDDVLSALRSAAPAMDALQRWCDERFLRELPQAARKELDGLANRPRFELARDLARQAADDPLLAGRHQVRLVGFEDLTPSNALGDTDLFAPIGQLLAGSLDEVVSGVVLASDGRQNLPERPEVLRRLASRDAPLLLAGVGASGELPNVALADYQLPGLVQAGQDATLVADLKATVPKGTPIQVELSAGAKSLATQSLEADGTGQARVALGFRMPESGGDGLLLSARIRGADAAGDAQASLAPCVLSRTARVLVVARWPRWDLVYLLSALRGKPCRVDLALWGAVGGPSPAREAVPAGQGRPAHNDAGDNQGVRRGLGFGKIPDQLSHLKRYGLVVLDGEPFAGMTEADGQLFASYVREAGGALLAIADGETWYGSKLPGILPGGRLRPLEGERPPMCPPPAAALFPAVSLSADSATSLGMWSVLPPAQHLWAVPDQAIPLLAAGGRTLLSVGFYGRGKVYAFGCGDLFRLREWDRGEPKYPRKSPTIPKVSEEIADDSLGYFADTLVQRFLANLLDDALQPTFRDEKGKLGLYPFAPRAGATAHVLLDNTGTFNLSSDTPGTPLVPAGSAPAGAHPPTGPGKRGMSPSAAEGARVTLADGSRVPLAFEPFPGSPGLAHATFRVGAAGRITVEVPGMPPLSARVASSVSREDTDSSLDEATLRRMAGYAGGRYVPLHDLPEAIAELPPRRDHRVAVRQVRLWNLWWLLPTLAALMVADWVLRRRNSLVL